jgi:hypothetical protein
LQTNDTLKGDGFSTSQMEYSMASVRKLTRRQVAVIKARLKAGEYQHRIAADFDLNQGRISEIRTGKRFADVPPAEGDHHHGA